MSEHFWATRRATISAAIWATIWAIWATIGQQFGQHLGNNLGNNLGNTFGQHTCGIWATHVAPAVCLEVTPARDPKQFSPLTPSHAIGA